jgi:hypothetical protein
MAISYDSPPTDLDLADVEVRRRRKRPVDYLGFAHRLTELRGSPKSTLRQMSRQQYVQFCNVCASVFSELDIKFDARTLQEACNVVGNENPPYVGDPLHVQSWEKAVKIAEGRGQAVLVRIGRNVAKVFPQWLREGVKN